MEAKMLGLSAGSICAVCSALFALSTLDQTKWRFPVTIEALEDVPAQVEETAQQVRGVLYVGRGPLFTVKKGRRFLMLKVNKEGGCRIEFEKKQYDVSSCPWLDGFTDHQEDVFKVVSERQGRHAVTPGAATPSDRPGSRGPRCFENAPDCQNGK
jgi:hypothetical protein